MFLSKSIRKRELATACRMGFEMAGILIALILQGLFLGNKSERCISLNKTEINLNSSNEVGWNSSDTNFFENYYNSQKYFLSAVIVVAIYFFCLILFFTGTRENLGNVNFFISNLEIQ